MISFDAAQIADNKEMTFEQFAISCLSHFGIYTRFTEEQRKELLEYKLPEKFEPSDFHLKEYERLQEEYKNFLNNPKTDDELEQEYGEYVKDVIENNERRFEEKKRLCKRYEDMLSKVKSWIPPSIEHNGIKSFMEEELKYNIIDCGNIYQEEIPPKDEWIANKKNTFRLIDDMKYHLDKYKEDVEDAKKATEFIQVFAESIKNVK